MSRERLPPRVVTAVAVVSLIVAVVGFVVTMVLNAFVFDEFDAYGEVPIPGSGSVELPAGEVTISFHTLVTGGGDSGLPVPRLGLSFEPPEGVPQPVVTEKWGGTTTVNNDARVRVWVARIPAEGTYGIVTDGQVNGYINPQLAFGRDSSAGWPLWAFGGLFVAGLVGVFVGITWSTRVARRPRPIPGWTGGAPAAPRSYAPAADTTNYAPTDHGIRIEQIRTLAALRDSGALTEEEFEAEKRRILAD